MALGLVDAFLTIVHPDLDGPMAKRLQRGIWSVTAPIARRSGGRRRLVLTIAGPLMLAATIFAWVATIIVGFAFLAWPHLWAGFGESRQLDETSFLNALYYSGVTATTLGYGDITPTHPALKVLAFVEAAIGFGLLTSAITYLLGTLSGISERNTAALRFRQETGGSGDGVMLVTRSLAAEEVEDLRSRLEGWAQALRVVQERLMRYPILAFYYRSMDPAHDPEPMIGTAADAAVAAHALALHDGWHRLGPTAEDLDASVTHFMRMVARQYLSPDVVSQIERPTPTAEDDARVRDALGRVRAHLPDADADIAAGRAPADLACRTRVFLDALDDLTGWRTATDSRSSN